MVEFRSKDRPSLDKGFRVGILFCEDDQAHNGMALDIFERLKEPSSHGSYSPALISSRFDERDFRLNMLEIMKKKYDLLMPIGNYFTTLTSQIYKELDTVVQTVFVAVTDPVALGLVNSLERPGGYMSGVTFEEESPRIYAHKVALLSPKVSNILVPYGPECLSGLLEGRAKETDEVLRSLGLNPTLVPVYSAQDVLAALDKYINSVDSIMLLEGCFATMVISELVARSWPLKKPVITANSKAGLLLGATASYGRDYNDVTKNAVEMVYRALGERIPLANQPVVMLPSNRIFMVNEALLQQIGDVGTLVKKLQKLEVAVVRFWPMPPSISDGV